MYFWMPSSLTNVMRPIKWRSHLLTTTLKTLSPLTNRYRPQKTNITHSTMHLFHFPQCNIQSRNMHISVLTDALWDMGEMHHGNCDIGLLSQVPRPSINLSFITDSKQYSLAKQNAQPNGDVSVRICIYSVSFCVFAFIYTCVFFLVFFYWFVLLYFFSLAFWFCFVSFRLNFKLLLDNLLSLCVKCVHL